MVLFCKEKEKETMKPCFVKWLRAAGIRAIKAVVQTALLIQYRAGLPFHQHRRRAGGSGLAHGRGRSVRLRENGGRQDGRQLCPAGLADGIIRSIGTNAPARSPGAFLIPGADFAIMG